MLHDISVFDLLNSISETPPEPPDTNEDPQEHILPHHTYISPADI